MTLIAPICIKWTYNALFCRQRVFLRCVRVMNSVSKAGRRNVCAVWIWWAIHSRYCERGATSERMNKASGTSNGSRHVSASANYEHCTVHSTAQHASTCVENIAADLRAFGCSAINFTSSAVLFVGERYIPAIILI